MNIKINKKNLFIENVEKASWLKNFTGLMFKGENANPILFNIPNSPIHSLFCKPFLAIWFNKGKIIDIKFINSVKLSIKPKKSFTHLLEIPYNHKYQLLIKKLLGK